MGKFLDACHQPGLNQDEANSFKRPIKTKKIESVVKNLPTKQTNKKELKARYIQHRILSIRPSKNK